MFVWCPACFSLAAVTIMYNVVSYDTEDGNKKVLFSGFAIETACQRFLYLDQDFRLRFKCALNSPQLDATKRHHHPASLLVALHFFVISSQRKAEFPEKFLPRLASCRMSFLYIQAPN